MTLWGVDYKKNKIKIKILCIPTISEFYTLFFWGFVKIKKLGICTYLCLVRSTTNISRIPGMRPIFKDISRNKAHHHHKQIYWFYLRKRKINLDVHSMLGPYHLSCSNTHFYIKL